MSSKSTISPRRGLSKLKLSFYKKRLGVEQENQSTEWGSGPQQKPSITSQTPVLAKERAWNQEQSKAWDNLKPTEFTDLHKTSTGSGGEQSLWARAGISPSVTLPRQFPLLWFENHLRAVLQLPAHFLQLLPSATKLFGCLRGARKGPASSVSHKRTESMKEITGSVPLSSPSLNSTCELYSHRAFP